MFKAQAVNYPRTLALAVLVILVVMVTACGSPAPATTSQVSGLDTSYANALNDRTQLLLGIVRLEEGTGPGLTQDQATKLLPLWQASKSLTASGTASQAEIDAVTNQILGVMTSEQIKQINAMHLTQADMLAFNQTIGVAAPSGAPAGGPPGQGQTLSPAERATRQAQFGGTGNSTASVDYVLGLLTKKAGK